VFCVALCYAVVIQRQFVIPLFAGYSTGSDISASFGAFFVFLLDFMQPA
jgi:hypothetical protein